MLNDLFRTYKKIIILVLIVLCMVIFWFYGCHRQQHGSETTQIELPVVAPYNGGR